MRSAIAYGGEVAHRLKRSEPLFRSSGRAHLEIRSKTGRHRSAFAWCDWISASADILATRGRKNGGADGGRTRDLLNAIQARSQLRHSPTMETLIVAKGRSQVNKTGWPGKGEEERGPN